MDDSGAFVLAVCGMAFEAGIARGAGVIAVHGPGEAVVSRLERVLAGGRTCRGIVSFGIAGGLDPALRPGACVLADTVLAGGQELAADEGWLASLSASLPGAVIGTLAGTSEPVLDGQAKRALRERGGACAVDMESHLAAVAARRLRLPFAALRIVADPAHRGIPTCAIAGLRADGTTAAGPLLRALAARPAELPLLAMLAIDAFAARRGLRAARRLAGDALREPGG